MSKPAVICNGLQKSGLHLLQKDVQLMGWERAPDKFDMPDMTKEKWHTEPYGPGFCDLQPGTVAYTHLPYPADMGQHKFIGIRRDPRNVLLSAVRWKHSRHTSRHPRRQFWEEPYITEEMLLHELQEKNFVAIARQFTGWVGVAPRIVDFESLIGPYGASEVQMIADYLEVEVQAEHILEKMIGGTLTYTARYSCWRDVWTPAIHEVWQAKSGPALVDAFLYPNGDLGPAKNCREGKMPWNAYYSY